MGKVPGDQYVARLAAQTIAQPRRRVVRLQIPRRRQVRERVAGPPERFGGLPRPQLAAVPGDRGPRAAPHRLLRRPLDGLAARRREWTPGIEIGSDGVAMMNEEEMHSMDYGERF